MVITVPGVNLLNLTKSSIAGGDGPSNSTIYALRCSVEFSTKGSNSRASNAAAAGSIRGG